MEIIETLAKGKYKVYPVGFCGSCGPGWFGLAGGSGETWVRLGPDSLLGLVGLVCQLWLFLGIFSLSYRIQKYFLVRLWSLVVQKFDDLHFFNDTNVISKVYGDTPILDGLVFNPFPL